MRHALTPDQVTIHAPLWNQRVQAFGAWEQAMALMRIKSVVGGDLDGDDPYLLESEEPNKIEEVDVYAIDEPATL